MSNTLKNLALAMGILLMPYSVGAEAIYISSGYGAGSGSDSYARLVGDHLGKFLPDDTELQVRNIPGAGSLKLAREIYNSGASDVPEIVSINQGIITSAYLKPEKVRVQPHEFHWIGGFGPGPTLCVTTKASGILTLEDFRTKKFKLAATSNSSGYYANSMIAKQILSAEYDIVTGFKSLRADILVAMQRGEVAGFCGPKNPALAATFNDDEVTNILSIGNDPDKIATANIYDHVETDLDRNALDVMLLPNDFRKPYLMPAGTDAETVETFSQALQKMAEDSAFQEDLLSRNLAPGFVRGSEIQAIVEKIRSSDEEVLARARELQGIKAE